MFGLLLAWRNYHQGRGDTQGALRLAAFIFATGFFDRQILAHHVPTTVELDNLVDIGGLALFWAGFAWTVYIALEPYARRRWPQALISWTRMLAGDVRDPLVGGHILAGTAIGLGLGVVLRLSDWFQMNRGIVSRSSFAIQGLDGVGLAGILIGGLNQPVLIALGYFFLIFLLRVLLRREWVAALVSVAIFGALGYAQGGSVLSGAGALLAGGAFFAVLKRFGLLAIVVTIVMTGLSGGLPLTSDFSAWYAKYGLIFCALTIALAVWSFRRALGGRKVLKVDFLET